MWQLAGKSFNSRLLIGTALYPSLQIMREAIKHSQAEIMTVSLQRQQIQSSDNHFWQQVQDLPCQILPNTAGCFSVQEAVTMAEMSRELFSTDWIKLEVTGDRYTLQPDPFQLVTAAKILVDKGFTVFPYCTEDLVLAQRLRDIGCQIIMPWGSPIGSGKGLLNPYALELLRTRLPDVTLIVDAGIGKTSHAVHAMELGYDGVLLNSAVALAHDPVKMAGAFRDAVCAGRAAFEAGMLAERNCAQSSTPLMDTPFWHQETCHE